MKRCGTEAATRKDVPVECFEMSEVKDQPMALGDRARIKRLGLEQIKQTVRCLPGASQFLAEFRKQGIGGSEHLLVGCSPIRHRLNDASSDFRFCGMKTRLK